jgi:hypothetical protein
MTLDISVALGFLAVKGAYHVSLPDLHFPQGATRKNEIITAHKISLDSSKKPSVLAKPKLPFSKE